MAIIGNDFPQSREARKAKLRQILKEHDPISTVKIPGRGKKSVYRIPLEFLSYNPHNTRFLAEAKTVEKRFGSELSDENPDHVREIESFIWDNKKEKNDSTIESLIKDGQLQPGVVTIDGIVLSGNRRFRLLNEISRNIDKYNKPGVNLDGLGYFEAAILDEELNKKDIIRYESYYQYGTEDKVDYGPIQKYIAAHDQSEIGFTPKEIAENFMTLSDGGKERKAKDWLEVYELMDEYLDYIGEQGIYTALESQEESFLRLRTDLKSLTSGRVGSKAWSYSEFDVDDFKKIFFDYIRKEMPTHEFRVLKEVFLDESKWKSFNSSVREAVDGNEVDDFEAYRKKFDDGDESTVSKIRRKDYISNVGDELDQVFGRAKAKVLNDKIQELPLDILRTIQDKLAKLEKDMANHIEKQSYESEDFLEAVKDVQRRVGKIKQQID